MLQGNREKLVITVSGNKVPREQVRRIKGEFYEIGKDCHNIRSPKGERLWYRVSSGKIGYKVDTDSWDLLQNIHNLGLSEGVYNKNGEKGYFAMNKYKNVYISESFGGRSITLCYNSSIARSLGYEENPHNGLFIKTANLSEKDLKVLKEKGLYRYPNIKLNYGANDGSSTFTELNVLYNDNISNIKVEDRTTEISKIFGNLSFGLEFETCRGVVPVRYLGDLGLVPLRDGSLRDSEGREPYEYTTVPLRGAPGLQTLKSITEKLSTYCDINEKCSLHVHIGGFKVSQKMILALYILSYNLQEEFLSMMPLYKADPQKYLGSSKNYCKMLPDLGIHKNNINAKDEEDVDQKTLKYFNKLFSWTTDNIVSEMNRDYNLKSFNHPKGAKWNQEARYHHINLVPTIFSRTGTIEFRLHTPTTNFTKTINWLFICNALVRFAQNNIDGLIDGKFNSITLKDVLEGYSHEFDDTISKNSEGENVFNYLNDYVNFRKDIFSKNPADVMGTSTIEFENDASFTFRNTKMNNLF